MENITSGETIEYVYDGQGNRVGAIEGNDVRQFLVAPGMGSGLNSTDLIADGNGNLISNYVYAGGASPFMMLDANGNPVYYLSDGMGSVIGLANGSGNEVGDFRYDSFGNVREEWGGAIGSAGGDFRFQGHWLESDTGIYHFRARDYDAKTGTFLSRDPIDPTEQQPEALNPYQFAYNNPHLYSDPTGMFTITEINSSQAINNILQNAQRLAVQQARESLIDTARGVAGDVIKSALKKLTPFDSVTGILDGNFLSGNGFASLLKDSVCELIPAPEGIKNRAWFEVDVEPRGNPQTNGFNCGETVPSPEEFTSRYGTYSLLDRNQNPRVDFIFKSREPFTYDRNPPAYLIGDVKRSVSGIRIGNRQWDAIVNYAQPSFRIKNGNRGHQYIPMALYMTLFNDNTAHERQITRQGLREGVKMEVLSFFDR